MAEDPINDARLRAEAASLRAVATALVQAQDSEDLVQDALLTALSASEAPRKLGPWLRQVLRNRVKMSARAGSRRRAREIASEGPAGPDSPDDVAFRRELLTAIRRCLEDLDEPYRTTLRQRFLEEREPAEIARATDTAPATVRWRVHEGLRRLRENLDAHFEGRAQWLLGLAVFLGIPAAACAAGPAAAATTRSSEIATTTGDESMKSSVTLQLVGAGLAAIALVFAASAAMDASTADARETANDPDPEPQPTSEHAPTPGVAAVATDPAASTPPGLSIEDCWGDDCVSEPMQAPCVDPETLDEPIQVLVQWMADEHGGHTLTVEATSGCYDPDLCSGIERPQCEDGQTPKHHPEIAACLLPKYERDGPEQLLVGENWGFAYYIDPACGEQPEPDQAPSILPLASDDVDHLDPEQAIARFDLPALGPDAPAITVMECGAYSCFYTNKARPDVERLLSEHPDLGFRWLHFPHDTDARGSLAALAAEAAHRQGKFWAIHDALFEKTEIHDRADLLEVARAAGLDLARFESDLDAPATAQAVADQRAWCRAFGMLGTPTFFIEGRVVRGAAGYEKLEEVVGEVRAELGE